MRFVSWLGLQLDSGCSDSRGEVFRYFVDPIGRIKMQLLTLTSAGGVTYCREYVVLPCACVACVSFIILQFIILCVAIPD